MIELNQVNFSTVKLVIFDFDGVFTDNRVIVSEKGQESVICNRFDGIGLTLLKKACIDAMIMSTEKNPVVSARARKLKIKCMQSVLDKSAAVCAVAESKKIKLSEIVFLGNDINDICALEIVGFPIGVADCWPLIKEKCLALTSRLGGHGAVRELCEIIAEQKHNHV